MLRSTRSSSDLDRFFHDVDRPLGDGGQPEIDASLDHDEHEAHDEVAVESV